MKAPTFEQIDNFIKELRVTGAQFERFYNIPKGLIKHIKYGSQKLPVQFWPIIYERLVPVYGVGYTNSIKKQPTYRVLKKVKIHELENTHERIKNII